MLAIVLWFYICIKPFIIDILQICASIIVFINPFYKSFFKFSNLELAIAVSLGFNSLISFPDGSSFLS